MTTRHAKAPLLARRWRSLMLAAILLVLSGAVLLVWLRVSAEAQRADQLGAEAVRRGDAVTTLAEDVRVLREQVKAEGKTPAAPDPARAIADLPDRVETVPGVPGEQGEQGPRGERGEQGRSVTGPTGPPGATVTGPPGEAGRDGESITGPASPPGPAGEDGQDGKDGTDGRDGADGQNCPAGYSLQPPPNDPDALVCRRDDSAATSPSPSTGQGLLGVGMLAGTAMYRRL